MINLVQAVTGQQLATVRELFLEYATALNFTLDIETFDRDMKDLPGEYTPPEGRLYVAYWSGEVAGCIALKKLDAGVCELKRLWVKPQFRRKGIGRALVAKLIFDAREIGYRKMMLDTTESMTEAISLYEATGFRRTIGRWDSPAEGAIHFEMDLV